MAAALTMSGAKQRETTRGLGLIRSGWSLVDVHADLEHVTVTCEGRLVAQHRRCWARRQTITNPAHVEAAARLRAAFKHDQAARAAAMRGARRHDDGHPVQLRALPDYDALFGIDPTTFTTTPASTPETVR